MNNRELLVDFLNELITHATQDTLTDIQYRKIGEFYVSFKNSKNLESEEDKNIKYYMLGHYIYKNLLDEII